MTIKMEVVGTVQSVKLIAHYCQNSNYSQKLLMTCPAEEASAIINTMELAAKKYDPTLVRIDKELEQTETIKRIIEC